MASSAVVRPTSAQWNLDKDVGNLYKTGGTYPEFVVRRTGTYTVSSYGQSMSMTSGRVWYVQTEKDPNGTPVVIGDGRQHASAADRCAAHFAIVFPLTVGDGVMSRYLHTNTGTLTSGPLVATIAEVLS